MNFTPQQGIALTQLASALRPEWSPQSTGKVFSKANEGDGFPARDFIHAVRALIEYATATGPSGAFAKKTPAYFHEPGAWWETTAPPPPPDEIRRPCEDHPTFSAYRCPACVADVKCGQRPPEMVGRHYDITAPPEPGTYRRPALEWSADFPTTHAAAGVPDD